MTSPYINSLRNLLFVLEHATTSVEAWGRCKIYIGPEGMGNVHAAILKKMSI